MPKVTKSPSKSSPVTARPKPRPLRSPKKSVAALVDDEAVESDEGVMVDHPDPDGDPHAASDVDEDNLVTASDLDGYDTDFINDDDPFDEGNGNAREDTGPQITPPPSQFKKASELSLNGSRMRTPLKGRSLSSAAGPTRNIDAAAVTVKPKHRSDVIETLTCCCDRDMEAMDQDDSMFKKPTSLKRAALPPSLTTRSVAAKAKNLPVGSADRTAGPASYRRVKQENNKPSKSSSEIDMPSLADLPMSLRVPPFVVDGKMTEALYAVVAALAAGKPARQSDATETKVEAGSPQANDSDSDSEVQLDHDQLALEEGIRSSLGLSTRLRSPDWDPPYAGEVVEEAFVRAPGKRTHASGGSPARPVTRSSKRESHAADPSPDSTVKSERSSSPAKLSDSKVSFYMKDKKKPVMASSTMENSDSAPLTMAQLLRVNRGEAAEDSDPEQIEDTPQTVGDAVFLEDLETYKAYFDPDAACGVNDLELQDDSLKPHYAGLPPLPKGRRLLPAYDKDRSSLEEIDWTTGGRIKFSSWFDQNPRMLAANSMGAMLFQSAEPNYINPSRDRIAVCVSAVCSAESHLTTPMRIGAKSDRERKWFSGVFHDQDWERFESLTSLVFGEPIMYGQMQDKAISFQTMISPDLTRSQAASSSSRSLPSSMFSTRSPDKSGRAAASKSDKQLKTLLAYNDPVPVYDARKKIVDFSSDLDRLAEVLPLFNGEVPIGSFSVVGYTCSSYRGTVSGAESKVAHLSLNVLWVIVCGTPGIRSSRQ
ncbi:hypothetical protein C8R46DRAFT_1228748 [Mycena filopes]|nr:hypothetical protein C8R46DRAFT_1228638 [Mycena filopes]KAJ7152529.1 hypothetical protein C8R46DRAFT_1228748 [Mycena filopes]